MFFSSVLAQTCVQCGEQETSAKTDDCLFLLVEGLGPGKGLDKAKVPRGVGGRWEDKSAQGCGVMARVCALMYSR